MTLMEQLELAAASAGITLRPEPSESELESRFTRPLPYRCQMDDCEHAIYGLECQ